MRTRIRVENTWIQIQFLTEQRHHMQTYNSVNQSQINIQILELIDL